MALVSAPAEGQQRRAPGILATTLLLTVREIRTVLRMPEAVAPSLFIPVFMFFVMGGMLEGFAASFGIADFRTFFLPLAITLAVVFGSSGQNLVADLESGYFERLLTTPTRRVALILGPLLAELLRVSLQGALVLGVAVASGVTLAGGWPAAAALILLGALWGLAFNAFGFAVALRTGSPAATQSASLLFFPFVFLAPTFAPRESMVPWLSAVASVNPLTYIVEAMRSLALDGGEPHVLALGFAAALSAAAVSFLLTFLALHARIR